VRLVGILVGGLCAGCSIVFNTNDLPRVSDAPPADTPIYDVNPNGLALTAADPSALAEGTGTSMGRPAVVVVTGANIDDQAEVSIVAGADAVPPGLKVGAKAVSHEHDLIAFEVTVPVLPALHEGGHLGLAVHVTNPGGVSQDLPITIDGLDDFTPPAGNVDVATVHPLYATATFTAATHFTGAKPLHLRVTGGITISAAIDANASGQTAGPGGCGGGGPSGDGDCGSGGGHGGGGNASGVAGGGGGFGTPGKDGSGGGARGDMTGDPMLVTLDYNGSAAGNRGNGGGGGGGALLGLGSAGAGGGGGGTIDLAAGGTITIMSGGSVHANGGNGGNGSGVGPGAGGAGSGGAILIRTGAGVVSSGAWLAVDPGAIGTNGSSNEGGEGGVGRIRVDTPSGAVAGMAVTPAPTQGASWAVGAGAAPTIVRTATPMLPLVGNPGNTYGVRVGSAVSSVTLVGQATTNAQVTLQPGRNQVCAVADGQIASASSDVALDCIDVAYVP
jgi:hypothetical protein